MRHLTALVLAGAASALLAAPLSAEMLAHRAAYDLSLAHSEAAAGLAEVRGALVTEWQPSCDGFISRQRIGFIATTDEGDGFSYDVRFSSWESEDSSRLRFNVRSFDNGVLFDEVRGDAVLDSPGGAGEARYSHPFERTVDLPMGTVFPTGHIRSLLASARAGDMLVSHELFDGSSLDALVTVTSVIGSPRDIARASSPSDVAGWPVAMAYYSAARPIDLPELEVAFQLADNGVLREVVLDYGAFSLDATLIELEPLPAPVC